MGFRLGSFILILAVFLPQWHQVSPPLAPLVPAAPGLPVLPGAGQPGDPLLHLGGQLLLALGVVLRHSAPPPIISTPPCCQTSACGERGRQHLDARSPLGRPHRSLLSVFPCPLPSKALVGWPVQTVLALIATLAAFPYYK